MRLLLDTHALIWFLEDDSRLPERMFDLIEQADTTTFVSFVSVWEVAIKGALGKLPGAPSVGGIEIAVAQNGFRFLNFSFAHAETVRHLPFHHRDPFDRLLLAQASVEELTLVSRDEHFAAYGVPVVW